MQLHFKGALISCGDYVHAKNVSYWIWFSPDIGSVQFKEKKDE